MTRHSPTRRLAMGPRAPQPAAPTTTPSGTRGTEQWLMPQALIRHESMLDWRKCICMPRSADLWSRIVNVKHGQFGRTRIMFAAVHADTERIGTLLQFGADVNIKAVGSGYTALTYARLRSHTMAVVAICTAPGVHLPEALESASALGLVDTVHDLLTRGADPNVPLMPQYNWTALEAAAEAGHADVVRVLIEAGAIVDAADARGQTALMQASEHGHAVAVQVLCEHHANVDHGLGVPNGTTTALQRAVYGGHVEVVRILCRHGAAVTQGYESMRRHPRSGQIGARVRTPLQLALERGHTEVAEELQRYADQGR